MEPEKQQLKQVNGFLNAIAQAVVAMAKFLKYMIVHIATAAVNRILKSNVHPVMAENNGPNWKTAKAVMVQDLKKSNLCVLRVREIPLENVPIPVQSM